jgi:hypothetical protein
MLTNEYDEFKTLLTTTALVFGKKLTDELVQAYWGALDNVALSTVREALGRAVRFGKFFPKPFELRDRDDKPLNTQTGAEKARWDEAQRYNRETWDALLAKDYDHNKWRLLWATMCSNEARYAHTAPHIYEQKCDWARGLVSRWIGQSGPGVFQTNFDAWQCAQQFNPKYASIHAPRKGPPPIEHQSDPPRIEEHA